MDPIKKATELLEQAKLESTFSILRAEEFYRQAVEQAKQQLPEATDVYIKVYK